MSSARPVDAARATSAFTLIELLVTVVILSTGIIVILQAFQTSMVALASSRDRMRSAVLGHALMVQGELAARGSQATIDDAILQSRFPEYRWRVDVQSDFGTACTNTTWRKAEIVAMLHHEMIGHDLEVASWVQVQDETVEAAE